MWPETSESPQPLRSGLTTGSCATACCVAAAQSLLAKKQPNTVDITLPRGQTVQLTIVEYTSLNETAVRVSTIKDAGDDPDATHGATVFVELKLTEHFGITFKPAEGVGTVTREGLPIAVGEAAINPVPRQMMTQHLTKAADVYGYTGGFEVSVGVVNGEQIALKTMNPRLGIVGGLSILGTTGIVRPYSCAAYIASIRQGVDVALANGISHIAATTGSTSETAIKDHHQLSDMALIEMGDFVGALLKHLRKAHVAKLSICAGFGKLTKLAQGHLDLNSRSSAIDFDFIAEMAANVGANETTLAAIKNANTTIEALNHCQLAQIPLADEVCKRALLQAQQIVLPASPNTQIEVIATDRKGQFVGSAGHFKQGTLK